MLKRELEYFFGALRFFTRLPVPAWVGHSSEALDRATRYFPAVGLLIGAIAALVFILTSYLWPTTLAVLAAMASSLYLTGAFHEDGWSDMVDGFGGGWDKTQIMAIMKDSRIGSFGAIALVMLLLARFCALIELDWLEIPLALLAGHTLSRFAATTLLRSLDYVRDEGKAKPLATRISWGELAFAGLTALLPLLLLPPLAALLGCLLAALATLWLARLFRRQIGGYTGDCLGATQQLSEVAFYCGLLCNFSLIRHPRPLLAAGICYGQLDVEAEDPQPIAERLRPLLPANTPVIASPLRRARCLAEALHPQARCDRRLLEIDFGAWEGQAWDQIDRRLLDAWAADVLYFAPPGGESAAALQARVVDCVRGLRGDGVALVTHAGTIRALLGYWLQLPIGDWSRLPLAFGSITLLEIDATGEDQGPPGQGQPGTPGVLRYLNR